VSLSHARELSVSEIETVASYYKEDLQRTIERKVRQKDLPGALSALEGREYVDGFVYQLKLRASSSLGQPTTPRRPRIRISEKVRAYGRAAAAQQSFLEGAK
jgi:hypothetical protein